MSKNLRLFFKATFFISVILLLAIAVLPLWTDAIDSELLLKIVVSIAAIDVLVGLGYAIFCKKD